MSDQRAIQRLRAIITALCLALFSSASAAADAPAEKSAAPDRAAMWASMLAKQRTLAVSAAFDAHGILWRVHVDGGRVVVDRSNDAGASFSAPVAVSNEDEVIGTEGDSRPKIALAGADTIYISYTQLREKPFSGDIRFSRSIDGGRNFSAPITINDDRNIISHRFDALLVGAHDEVYLAWLDRRDEQAAREQDQPYAGAAIYYAISTDRGAHFADNVKLADHSCECCRIALALAPDGVPRAFWRHVFANNERDHALAPLAAPAEVRRITHDEWRIEACPHHGPALAINAQGTYHFAWFDNGPQARGLFLAQSSDGGKTVSPPMALGDPTAKPSNPALLVHRDTLYAAWKEFDGETSPIRAIRSEDGGRTWFEPVTLARTADASDHPQLIAHGEQAFLSWNTANEGYRLIPLDSVFKP
ncbi:MAG: glycoside hydrolase [Chromatiales bacterium]|jgi:hypothetical protein|nr:glycoside hydrolase [Chromatiales bacterium]